MGFLDSSTNNIILDAVLTDTGRAFLARNDGSFNIVKFAVSDDEVNYTFIEKFGRSVGKERIEKLTPVFEALTNPAYAQKYKCVSVSNPNLIRLPSLSLSGDTAFTASSSTITLGRNAQKTSTLTVEQSIENETSIDVELRDQAFIVELPNMFVQLVKNSPENVDVNNRATYIVTKSANENSFGGSTAQFTIAAKSISDATYTVYGTTANKSRIKAYGKVTGLQSGSVVEFTLVIDKTL